MSSINTIFCANNAPFLVSIRWYESFATHFFFKFHFSISCSLSRHFQHVITCKYIFWSILSTFFNIFHIHFKWLWTCSRARKKCKHLAQKRLFASLISWTLFCGALMPMAMAFLSYILIDFFYGIVVDDDVVVMTAAIFCYLPKTVGSVIIDLWCIEFISFPVICPINC